VEMEVPRAVTIPTTPGILTMGPDSRSCYRGRRSIPTRARR
jgi:hypothetical protein